MLPSFWFLILIPVFWFTILLIGSPIWNIFLLLVFSWYSFKLLPNKLLPNKLHNKLHNKLLPNKSRISSVFFSLELHQVCGPCCIRVLPLVWMARSMVKLFWSYHLQLLLILCLHTNTTRKWIEHLCHACFSGMCNYWFCIISFWDEVWTRLSQVIFYPQGCQRCHHVGSCQLSEAPRDEHTSKQRQWKRFSFTQLKKVINWGKKPLVLINRNQTFLYLPQIEKVLFDYNNKNRGNSSILRVEEILPKFC